LVVASFRVSPVPPLRWFGATYVELVRNCPLTVLFFLFWFGLPNAGVQFPRFPSAVIVLAVYTGAFVAEAIRSGIKHRRRRPGRGRPLAGADLTQVLGQVVLPQALRAVVAPLGNVFIALIKNSSIAYTISVVELTGQAQTLAIRTTEVLPVFGAAASATSSSPCHRGSRSGARAQVAIKR
jgi:glutamate transport system permease protein